MCYVSQSELVSPVQAALDHYVKLQEMELEKLTDEDVHSQQQQQQLATGSSTAKSQLFADKASSVEALGFTADHKFKVQKIMGRPVVK